MLPWDKNILVTGGLGFIGSHLVERLLNAGHAVLVVDNFDETLYPAAVKRLRLNKLSHLGRARFKFVKMDISMPGVFPVSLGHLQRPDLVIHLAAIAGVRPSLENPVRYSQVNVVGTMNLLDWSMKQGIKKVVCASSSSVYGTLTPPFDESRELTGIISPYALSKRQGELACDYYAREYGINTVSLRFFTVYGPRQRPDMFIRKTIQNVLEDRELVIYGDGTSYRDYTYVDDIVGGMMALVKGVNEGEHETYNLGCGRPTYLNDLVKQIEDAVGKKASVRHIEDQKGDVPGTLADITRAKTVLGYNPSTSVEEGIPKMMQWVRENG